MITTSHFIETLIVKMKMQKKERQEDFKLERGIFERAQEAVKNFLEVDDTSPNREQEKAAVQEIIQEAYAEATPEEQNQLKQFEDQIR